MFRFDITHRLNAARVTTLTTPHGLVSGPFFQFVATQAAIRGMVFSEDLERLEAQVVLANTYHLHIRPGAEVVADNGGLHGFMQWDKPVTTDSGGYQVFSLGQHVELDEEGVTFRAPLDGTQHRLTPEGVIDIQGKLGADIIMPLDVCTPFRASHEEVAAAVDQTTRWAQRSKERWTELTEGSGHRQALYGIVQGGLYPDLRERSATTLQKIGFFGYSIGGELRDADEQRMEEGVRLTAALLPDDAPRYLMGAGTPEDIVRAVRLGIDQFDCVLPVRNARHGKIYRDLNVAELARCLRDPERPVVPTVLYHTVDMRKSAVARDLSVFAAGNPVISKPYSMAYVHHLLRAEAPSGVRLTVLNNIYFYVKLMQEIRSVLTQHGT